MIRSRQYTELVAPRRTPEPANRRRDAERARGRLLDAALKEFAAKGFAGARVREIAARAGLNQQLISYYFGGKAGLYQALQNRWNDASTAINQPGAALTDVVVAFLHAGLANPAWTRLLVWQNMTDDPTGVSNQDLMTGMADDLRRRQQAGELATDLDPTYLALVLFAAAAAPTILPAVTRSITGLDPTSPRFDRTYATQLAALIRHLSPADSPETS